MFTKNELDTNMFEKDIHVIEHYNKVEYFSIGGFQLNGRYLKKKRFSPFSPTEPLWLSSDLHSRYFFNKLQ